MGVMPVKKLIITMSLPMMVSMLVQALYNVVDSIFVARLSENALTAVTLAASGICAGSETQGCVLGGNGFLTAGLCKSHIHSLLYCIR